MPISFIIVGIILIYIIFYKPNLKYKNVCISMFIFLMLGYFVSEVNILHGVLVNVLICIPVGVFGIYFIVNLKKIDGIIFFVGVVISILIYVLMVYKDIENSTLFSPLPIFLVTLLFAALFSFNFNLSISYVLSVFTMYDILNILLVKNSTGVVSILSISTFNLIVYILIISLCLNKMIELVKLKIKEKKLNE